MWKDFSGWNPNHPVGGKDVDGAALRKLNFPCKEIRKGVLSGSDGLLSDASNGRADGMNEQFGFNLCRCWGKYSLHSGWCFFVFIGKSRFFTALTLISNTFSTILWYFLIFCLNSYNLLSSRGKIVLTKVAQSVGLWQQKSCQIGLFYSWKLVKLI